VDDYGYDKNQIQTHPQYRVKVRPSDTKKEYPVDIAVFTDRQKNEDNAWIIVECKKRNREDGKSQLEDYLRFSKAPLGVWFNGEERLFLKKVEKEGRVLFEDIPNIPKQGQRIEDIGKFTRKDLEVPSNLKPVFKSIRNFLAGNTIGATRDELLAQQLIHLIFCKIYDEKWTKPNDMVRFRAGVDEKPEEIRNRIQKLFDDVKAKYEEVIGKNAEITLDNNSIYYIVGELQNYCLTEATRDAIADAFEIFITGALKGGQGQFFTPRNVVQMMVEVLDPEPEDEVIDPACGSGGFLIDAMRYMWSKIEAKGKGLGWSESVIEREKQKMATDKLRGIDKDQFLSQVTKAYMAIMGDGMGGVFCEDSLEREQNWKPKTRAKISLNQFKILLTNPPFGSKIPVKGEEKLKQFELAHKWKKDKKTKDWVKLNALKIDGKKGGIEPQILFIERAVQFLEPNGRMGIVLPDGIFGNDKLGYIRDFLIKNGRILAVIDVPIETFMPNTSTKTSILIYQKTKNKPEDYPIFMAVAEEVGHDRRGNPRENDDLLLVPKQYHRWRERNGIAY
jgi:type I restriction enzyme M protein